MPAAGHHRDLSQQVPAVQVGDRFTVDEISQREP